MMRALASCFLNGWLGVFGRRIAPAVKKRAAQDLEDDYEAPVARWYIARKSADGKLPWNPGRPWSVLQKAQKPP